MRLAIRLPREIPVSRPARVWLSAYVEIFGTRDIYTSLSGRGKVAAGCRRIFRARVCATALKTAEISRLRGNSAIYFRDDR